MTSIQKINILLMERGMTGADLCRALGVSTGVYSQWNTGRNKISAKNLKKIAEVFGVNIVDLLDDEETKNPATISDGANSGIIEELDASQDQKELINKILTLTPDRVSALLSLAKTL